jgi:hypothetical protein
LEDQVATRPKVNKKSWMIIEQNISLALRMDRFIKLANITSTHVEDPAIMFAELDLVLFLVMVIDGIPVPYVIPGTIQICKKVCTG